MPVARAPVALWIAVAACLALLAIQLGWLPGLQYQWGLALWRYLPAPVTWVLAAGVLLLCVPPVRALLARAASAVAARTPEAVVLALLVAAPIAFFLLRERQQLGDSLLYGMFIAEGWTIWAPELGSFFLLWLSANLADLLTCGTAEGYCEVADSLGITREYLEAAVALAGGVAVVTTTRLAHYLAPSPGRRAFVAVFILSGGLIRVFFGHLEAYAFVLAAAGGYLWAACALLEGRCRAWVPGAVLGVGVWIHFSLLLLVPTLLHVLWLSSAERSWPALLRRASLAAAWVAGPTALFLLVFWAAGQQEDLARVWTKIREILGLESHAAVGGLWLGGAGSRAKFLLNSFFMLAPAAFPVVLGAALAGPRRLVAGPTAAFLTGACVCTFVYALVLRPVWGPYDWDLFSLTAFCFAALAAHLLATLERERLAHLGTLLVGASLLFVTLPFIWIGIAPAEDAGPFQAGEERRQIEELWEKGGTPELFESLAERLEPWL